ncbi:MULTISPECIES: DNA polymerase III subunit epsilon [Pseudomonas syringae group]|uniref:DNA polymerase III subunit epsilon n=2 Tax=Pseudomonas cannabina TaxID=86840 RepID=A0A0P9NNK4_PSECA|nr:MULTISPECIES: DNA polymerase III subunit epsilon [Pseudomonas syringae group]KAA8704505.1 DNA polymerase III subunit epsilon [Pseudomonas cannabina]KPB75651.1 DNA polymerase III subunit epsilon [Pseudomonas syringae pv. maculicola]KPW19393.1 DNA polymerase III subunit epsilon [Pseudomonas cannabina pv. alisalensis]KPW72864.1 DNA polymerase III subunit epsilon [Pseudomonas cannabina]MBM0139693.1 DNA polymerase III subunit epsilon [Pseudomonas cannabina pv. alisalensis]
MAVQNLDNRSIVLDTETTGMPVTDGHRIIEIGCVELIGRRLTGRHFHVYLQPDRESDEGAIGVHGITNEFLVGKPRFAEVADEFFEFIKGAQLIIHNAAFDVGFINNEFALMGAQDKADITRHCSILDTLMMARERHPGQRNSLDALCKRYGVDNSGRELHGALLDSEILAEVYLAMTGGQTSLSLAGNASDGNGSGEGGSSRGSEIRRLPADRLPCRVIRASESELAEHEVRMNTIAKASGAPALWVQMLEAEAQASS